MKVCFLISGIPRRFSSFLKVYLDLLESYIDFDIFIYFPKERCEENYANDIFNEVTLHSILKNPRYKLILLDSIEPSLSDSLSRKQRNSILQWYRIHKCYQYINCSNYDFIIRIRPDINLLIDHDKFVSIIKDLDKSTLYIPEGFDGTDSNGINDQVAIASPYVMQYYCLLYNHINDNISYNSEVFLNTYLQENKIQIKRIVLPYKLALSDCKIIAIAGDSASGKTTLMKYIQEIMPSNSSLCIETDSYHKWERSDENWKKYTHLHPDANNLERMSEDLIRLKIGNNISMIEYDHCTGKFTQEKLIKGKPFILLCGLHTLYNKSLTNDLDLKIFLDTEDQLKITWKLERDSIERNYSKDKILETILKRKSDCQQFIIPQKDQANFLIRYSFNNKVEVNVILSNILSSIVHAFHTFFADEFLLLPSGFIQYRLKETLKQNDIEIFVSSISAKLIFKHETAVFQEGTTGILQLLIFLILFYNND